MYQKPEVQKFGSFRDLTQLGFANATDGMSILGIGTSPGCYTDLGPYGEYSILCPTAS